MNHDMAHCKGDGCMLNNICERHRAHLEYQADAALKAAVSVPYCSEDECLPRGYALLKETPFYLQNKKGDTL